METFHFVLSFFSVNFLEDNTIASDQAEEKLRNDYAKSCTEIARLKKELDKAELNGDKEAKNRIRDEQSHERKKWQKLLKQVKRIKE